jgi:hypothetical protein
MVISRWILLRMRNVSDKSCRQNQNTHFMFRDFSRKSCRLWDNVEKYGTAGQATDGNIIRRMRTACWITKATDTHTLRIFNTYCFSTATVVTRTRLNVTLHVPCQCCCRLLLSRMKNVKDNCNLMSKFCIWHATCSGPRYCFVMNCTWSCEIRMQDKITT